LKYPGTIRTLLAGLLLVLFAISITPRQFLHQWFATHKDSAGVIPANGQEQLSHVLTNCHCDNMVAESPFTILEEPGSPIKELPFPVYLESLQAGPVKTTLLFTSLRGPPSVS